MLGSSVDNLGDLDGDGVEDLAFGAVGDSRYGDNSGAEWIVEGGLTGTASVDAIATATIRGNGTYWYVGYGMSVADVTGDGVVDLVLSAASKSSDQGSLFVLPATGW